MTAGLLTLQRPLGLPPLIPVTLSPSIPTSRSTPALAEHLLFWVATETVQPSRVAKVLIPKLQESMSLLEKPISFASAALVPQMRVPEPSPSLSVAVAAAVAEAEMMTAQMPRL